MLDFPWTDQMQIRTEQTDLWPETTSIFGRFEIFGNVSQK